MNWLLASGWDWGIDEVRSSPCARISAASAFRCSGILPVGILMFLPAFCSVAVHGVAVRARFWLLALLGGFILAVLTLGLLFGWPIIWALAADKPDSFDAIGRGYQFTFQRPLNYFFYAVVAAVLVRWAGSWCRISLPRSST